MEALECYGALADVQACEERLVNLWPSHQTLVMGDWLCRMAAGYSGRANSAALIRPCASLKRDEIGAISALYRAAGLRPAFRLTPLAGEEVIKVLGEEGFLPEDASLGMIGPAITRDIPPALQLEARPGAAWITGACLWQSGAKRDEAALRGIVANIRLPVRFATLYHAGEAAAYGLVALDRGMAEFGAVMVNPALRGLGLGRALVSGMAGWAQQAGARQVFLQVAVENKVARGLYAALGFAPLYTAAYWRESVSSESGNRFRVRNCVKT